MKEKLETTWLLYCVPAMFRIRLFFIQQQERHEAIMKVRHRGFDVRCEGDLLGKRFIMEANSRARLPGDTKNATRIQFAGRFDHVDGTSGDFTIREGVDGSLMSLDVYGVPTAIRAVKTSARSVRCPLELRGLPDGLDVRFETTADEWHPPAISHADLPTKPAKRYYAGFCRSSSGLPNENPPAIAVLATFLLAHELILSPHYLNPS